MAKIYKRSDRIKIKIDDVIVTIAPLSIDQKTEAQDLMARGKIQKDYPMLTKGILTLIKYSLKNIEGLEQEDGTPYQLNFVGDSVADECMNDLFNIELHKKLTLVCSSLVGSFPSEFMDELGNPIEGVEIIPIKKEVPIPN